jgi:hypothetical protein
VYDLRRADYAPLGELMVNGSLPAMFTQTTILSRVDFDIDVGRDLPGWAALGVVALSVLLAVVTLVLLLRRPAPHLDAVRNTSTPADPPSAPRLDLMLLVSTLGVIALAVLVLMT